MTDLTCQAGNVGQDEQTNAEGITDVGLIVGQIDVSGIVRDQGRVRHQ